MGKFLGLLPNAWLAIVIAVTLVVVALFIWSTIDLFDAVNDLAPADS